MDFFTWRDSDAHEAKQFRRRMTAGETGNPENPEIAAGIAYKAGIEEGKRQAALILSELVTRGMPRGEIRFG